MSAKNWVSIVNADAEDAFMQVLAGSDVEVALESTDCKIGKIVLRNTVTGKHVAIIVGSYAVELTRLLVPKQWRVEGQVGTAPFESPWTESETEVQELFESLSANGAGELMSINSRDSE